MKNLSILNDVSVLIIRFYQRSLSLLLGPCCRFYPSCSEYARLCFMHYSFAKALGKSTWRLLRCHPLTAGYEDYPFPPSVHKSLEESSLD